MPDRDMEAIRQAQRDMVAMYSQLDARIGASEGLRDPDALIALTKQVCARCPTL